MAEKALKNGRMIWIIVLIVVVVGLSALVIWMALSRPSSSIQTSNNLPLVKATAELSMEHGMLVSMLTGQVMEFIPGDTMVYVPANSVGVQGMISIINLEPDLFPDAGEPGWSRPMIVNVEYCSSEGEPYSQMDFRQSIEICFSLTEAEWSDYTDHREDYQIHFYDENSHPPQWVSLPRRIYSDRLQLCGKTDHLSLFALAIRVEAEIDEPEPTETDMDLYEP